MEKLGLKLRYNLGVHTPNRNSQVVLVVKNMSANAGDERCRFEPWLRAIPWRRKLQPTSVFMPGASHGQRMIVIFNFQFQLFNVGIKENNSLFILILL